MLLIKTQIYGGKTGHLLIIGYGKNKKSLCIYQNFLWSCIKIVIISFIRLFFMFSEDESVIKPFL